VTTVLNETAASGWASRYESKNLQKERYCKPDCHWYSLTLYVKWTYSFRQPYSVDVTRTCANSEVRYCHRVRTAQPKEAWGLPARRRATRVNFLFQLFELQDQKVCRRLLNGNSLLVHFCEEDKVTGICLFTKKCILLVLERTCQWQKCSFYNLFRDKVKFLGYETQWWISQSLGVPYEKTLCLVNARPQDLYQSHEQSLMNVRT